VLEDYLRVVADFTWWVYLDTLEEEGYAPLPDCPSDLRLASMHDILDALSGLDRACGWVGPSGVHLRRLLQLAYVAVDAADSEIEDTILDQIVARTARQLYPVPVQAIEVDHDGAIEAKRFDIVREPMLVEPGSREFKAGDYFYLKPRYKWHAGLVKQHSRAARQGKRLHLYPAPSFGRPQATYLLCEGDTDQAVLEAMLDEYAPSWRFGTLIVQSCEGDIPGYVRTLDPSVCVVVADADMAPGKRTNERWERMWRQVRWGQVVEPDLERVDLRAYAGALSEVWGEEVDEGQLSVLASQARSGAEFEKLMKARFRLRPCKGTQVGFALARQYLATEIPAAISRVLTAATLLSRGFRPAFLSPSLIPQEPWRNEPPEVLEGA
jgi:hypothetical protein